MFNLEWDEEMKDRHIQAASLAPFGISFLDDALLGLLPNDLMLVGARTGRGKTELATSMAYNWTNAGKQVTFFALEADRWEIHRRMMYRKLAQLYHEHYATSSTFKFPRYREWLSQGFQADWHSLEKEAKEQLSGQTSSLRVVYKGDRYTPEDFVKEFEGLESETDIFIVDHLHYFDMLNTTESEGLKRAIHSIRNASLHHGKPVILLAHLRKGERLSNKTLPDLDDFHGHSDIVKVSTTALLMAPVSPEKCPADMGRYPTYFHVAKCRTAAEVTPFVGLMGFNFKTNTYSDQYFLQRASFVEDPKPIENPSEVPDWAKRAHRPKVGFIGGGYVGRRKEEN